MSNKISEQINIEGMTCVNCENRIERILKNTNGIESAKVNYTSGKAEIIFDNSIVSILEIKRKVEKLGYKIVIKNENDSFKSSYILKLIGVIISLVAIYIILNSTGALNIFNSFPTAKSGMGYGALFVIGLLTSIHCVGMCGGINLSQCVGSTYNNTVDSSKLGSLRPSFLYNLGRVISYTIVGVIIGALGSVVSFSGFAKGIVAIVAGCFMIIMALNMWGIFPWLKKFSPHMPKIFATKINDQKSSNNNPLFIGLLNGLMPCGPLQAMQLYALSTGNPIKGALSMFLFSVGTVPLMFGLGALSSVLNNKFQKRMMVVSASLVMLLGVSMFSNGMNLSGFPVPTVFGKSNSQVAQATTDFQTVTTTLLPNSYTPISVKKGVPVKWVVKADESSLNSCNNEILIPAYNIDKKLVIGDNVIEFTPTTSGTVPFGCWMGMIKSEIKVTD